MSVSRASRSRRRLASRAKALWSADALVNYPTAAAARQTRVSRLWRCPSMLMSPRNDAGCAFSLGLMVMITVEKGGLKLT